METNEVSQSNEILNIKELGVKKFKTNLTRKQTQRITEITETIIEKAKP